MCERESVTTPAPATPRSLAAWRRRARTKSGRPAKVGAAAQTRAEARLVGEDVLAEAGGQVGEPLHHLGIALLRRAVHACAGAHEVGVIALEHAQTARRRGRARGAGREGIDAREQGAVHVDAAVMRRQQRRHLALDRLQRRRGLARGEVVEQPEIRSNRRPARSSAATVLSKLGGSVESPMAPISSRWSRIATSKAGANCSARAWAKAAGRTRPSRVAAKGCRSWSRSSFLALDVVRSRSS
jgi:hypothetical protein